MPYNYNYNLANRYAQLYRNNMLKQAAQPPMDPSMMGGAPMDPSMMGGAPMDPSMMGGAPMPPGGGMPMDPSMMGGAPMPPGGGMPMDPSMMGGAPMDPSMMGGVAAPTAPAAPGETPKSSKQQKEDLITAIKEDLEDLKSYVYNNLMILIELSKKLGVSISPELLVAPPSGQNTAIMDDPNSIIGAASGPAEPASPEMGGGMPPEMGGGMPPEMGGGMPPEMAPPEQAPPKTASYFINKAITLPTMSKIANKLITPDPLSAQVNAMLRRY